MDMIKEVRPVTAFIGGQETIAELFERYRQVEASQWYLLADVMKFGGGESTSLLSVIEQLQGELELTRFALENERCELVKVRQELEAVRLGRNRLYESYCELARRFEPVNVEEME